MFISGGSENIFNGLAEVICKPDWIRKIENKEMLAIEDPGVHMCLKKLASQDANEENYTLCQGICKHLSDETVSI